MWSLDKADAEFSKWIRERDKLCYICGKNRATQNSHFWGRANSATRFDQFNCDGVCGGCHLRHEGNKQGLYKELKIDQIGEMAYEEMERRARSIVKRSDAIRYCMAFLGADFWLPIAEPGFSAKYEINPKGIVRNKETKKQVVPRVIREYHYVDLHNNGKRKNARLGRLVAKTFIPNPLNREEVNHIDGDRFNDSVSNLEWCTTKYNRHHRTQLAKKEGRYKPPIGNLKFPQKTINKVFELREQGFLHREIAKELGMGVSTVTHVLLGSRRKTK